MTEDRYTDVGNARRLVALHGKRLRYVPQWDTWLTWDGRRWRRDTKGQVVERAKDVAARLWDDASGVQSGDERKKAVKWALESEGATRIRNMVALARSEPGIPVDPDELDRDPWLLNVANGTVDLRTGQLRGHSPGHLITKVAPVSYDAGAYAPTWAAFLERIIPDSDVRTFVQRYLGYALTGDTSEQVMAFAYGSGANGKTTLTETFLRMVGDYGRQAEPDLLLARETSHPAGVADLLGARFVVASELNDGRRLDEARVKQLTGGDRVKARYLYGQWFEFEPTHTLWLQANHRPAVRGTDHAIWRRLKLVPFTVTIPADEQDHRLVDRLADELPGILRWALDGCLAWQRGGLTEPDAVRVATSEYRADSDVIGTFLAETCAQIDTGKVPADQLYRAYTAWCDDAGERHLSQRYLGRQLTDRGFERRKHGPERRWWWFGIALLDPEHEPKNPSEPSAELSPHTRARMATEQTKGSEGFKGSPDPRLPYKDNPE